MQKESDGESGNFITLVAVSEKDQNTENEPRL